MVTVRIVKLNIQRLRKTFTPLSLLSVFFLAASLRAHESNFSSLSSYEVLLLNAVPWPLQLADKFRCGVCSPLVGGMGFWARLLLLCRERSPLLWLWVWGGFELCTPLPPFLHPASQTPHTEQSWSGYRFGGFHRAERAPGSTVLGTLRWGTAQPV